MGKMRKMAGEAGTEEPDGGLSSGCLHPYSFIHSRNKYLLSTNYVPGAIPAIADIAMNKRDEDSCLYEVYIWGSGRE